MPGDAMKAVLDLLTERVRSYLAAGTVFLGYNASEWDDKGDLIEAITAATVSELLRLAEEASPADPTDEEGLQGVFMSMLNLIALNITKGDL